MLADDGYLRKYAFHVFVNGLIKAKDVIIQSCKLRNLSNQH